MIIDITTCSDILQESEKEGAMKKTQRKRARIEASELDTTNEKE